MTENRGKFTCFFAKPHCEAFAITDGERTIIRGYAAKFGAYSEDLGGFRTVIAPGTFDRVLPLADCRFLINHDANLLMGRTSSGTLKLSVDEVGLAFEGVPPSTDLAAHHVESIRRGDMDGCSFTCDIDIDEWDWSGETPIRTVKSVSALYDVGPVTFPAFASTSVSASASYALESARREQAEHLERIEAAARRGRRMRLRYQMVSLGL